VLGRAAGLDAVAAELALLLALAYAARTLGRAQLGEAGRRSLAAAGLVLVAAFSGVGAVGFEPEAASRSAEADFQPFDADAVRAAVAAGQPAFVYFTADWCLTCKLNERRVLSDPRVHDALERAGAARFRADWTRRDAHIGEELARHGRAGVPLYLVYSGGDPDHPQVLPELLSVDLVVDALAASASADQVPVRATR
jgi:thiol:disulfide interchange protein DsbD